MGQPISTIRNLGPATERAFGMAGISTAEEVHELGPDRAYARLLEVGTPPHFIGYYALVMGLQGRPWNDCRGEEKARLRARFDKIVASVVPAAPSGIEAELNRIGTGLSRN